MYQHPDNHKLHRCDFGGFVKGTAEFPYELAEYTESIENLMSELGWDRIGFLKPFFELWGPRDGCFGFVD